MNDAAVKRAFLFPGQGSQYVGMLHSLYDNIPEAREIVAAADEILGYSLSEICFSGPAETLQQTEHTQPALFLHGYVLYKLVNNAGFHPDAAAGHSLGEYTALAAAGAVAFEDALKIVSLRGKLMQEAGVAQPGTMAAVIGLDDETVIRICNEALQHGILQPANFNSPGQIVISGEVDAVVSAMDAARREGARLVKQLVVSGAFHSGLMQAAQDSLGKALADIEFTRTRIPVYANVSGEPVFEPDDIRSLLTKQITAPVLWDRSIRNMVRDGYRSFTELGPGKVLQGLVKRIDGDAAVNGVDTRDDLQKFFES